MPLLHQLANGLLVARINLVDDQDDRNGHRPHLLKKVGILLRVFHHISYIQQDVSVGQGRFRESQHVLLHLVIGFQHARSVGEHNLHVVGIHDSHDAMPGGLGLERCNGDALAHQLVHQRRLAHVWVAHNVYKTCLVHKLLLV